MAVGLKSIESRAYSAEYYVARDNAMFRAEVKHLLAACDLTPGHRLLEVGCGGGSLLRSCVASARAVMAAGVDMNRAGVMMARRQAPGAVLALGEAACLPFADGTFDAVVAQHVIEHLERPDEVVREWSRVLAPEGVITIATPNALYPDPQLFDDPTHCHIYTLAELRELFERNGFHVEQAYSLMPFLVSRRTTWRLARIAFGPMLELRRLPSFRERGLTLVLEARKDPPHHGDPPHEEWKHDPTC